MIDNNLKAKLFYNQGLRFLRCAERCLGEVNDDGSITIISNKTHILSTPVMVNSAFACELFLKAILILHDIDYKREHNLKPLFDLLPKNEYKEFLTIGDTDHFESELEKHSKDFVSWRYYMENVEYGETYHMEPIFTEIFMENLKELCKCLIEKFDNEDKSE